METPPASQDADAGGAGQAKLVTLTGRDKGQLHLLPRDGTMTLGRADDNSVVVSDPEVSRHHCSLVAAAGTYHLRDHDSTNGCFLDDRQVSEALLESGARFRIGQTTFVLVLPDETRAVAAAARAGEAEAPVTEPEEAPVPETPAPAAPRRRHRVRTAAVVLLVLGAAAWWAVPLFRGGRRLLPVGTRSVRVRSEPSGVEVFLDDRYVGLTPVEVTMTLGEPHVLRLTRRGYQTWRQAIESDPPAEIAATLRRRPAATLIVSASRPDTDVYLDGRLVGKTGGAETLRIPRVALGQHELRLQKPNYLTFHERVDVTRSGEIHVHGKLQSRQESSLLSLIEKSPKSALLYTELGHLYMVNKQLDKAMAAYEQAHKLVYAGTDTSGYRRRLRSEVQKLVAGTIFQYGSKDEMDVACRKLEDMFVSLAPDYPEAKSTLAWLVKHYTGRKQVDDAIRVYRKMLAVVPDDVNLYFRAAALCTSKNDFEAAIHILQRAADRFPDSWTVHYRLGQAYSQRAAADYSPADKRHAIAHLEKALKDCTSKRHKQNIQDYLTRIKALKLDRD
jgi:tetratricopeptide (TPR) repeat protein